MRQLLMVALALFVVTAGVSSNYKSATHLRGIKNRKRKELLNNITIENDYIIPFTTEATSIRIDDDYSNVRHIEIEATASHTNDNSNSNSNSNKNNNTSSEGNKNIASVRNEVRKQINSYDVSNGNALNNNEIHKNVMFDIKNNNNNNDSQNTDFARVHNINGSKSENQNNITTNNDINGFPSSSAVVMENTFKTLPRHQRAIAAVAEKKGFLRGSDGGERILRRGKRYLQFAKGSRVSWRTTGKNNILKVNTLWGYGYGFRANFPFPGPEESRRPFFKRDVLHSLADILDGHGLDGRACILKSYCTAALDVDSNISGGMLFKMLKLIFTLHENEKRHFPYLRLENCKQILHSHCPLSFNSISPYTDDV